MTWELRSTSADEYLKANEEFRTELLKAMSEAVLLSAAHLDIFQSGPSHAKLRAILNNVSDYHLDAIAAVAKEDR